MKFTTNISDYNIFQEKCKYMKCTEDLFKDKVYILIIIPEPVMCKHSNFIYLKQELNIMSCLNSMKLQI